MQPAIQDGRLIASACHRRRARLSLPSRAAAAAAAAASCQQLAGDLPRGRLELALALVRRPELFGDRVVVRALGQVHGASPQAARGIRGVQDTRSVCAHLAAACRRKGAGARRGLLSVLWGPRRGRGWARARAGARFHAVAR
jgi:hypothetical protein